MSNIKNDFIDSLIGGNSICTPTDSTILNISKYLNNLISESFK